MASAAMSLAARTGRASHRYVQTEPSFVPQATVMKKLGGETLNLYPLLGPEAGDDEKSHGFYINAQAIDCASTIHAKTKFIFFGESIC